MTKEERKKSQTSSLTSQTEKATPGKETKKNKNEKSPRTRTSQNIPKERRVWSRKNMTIRRGPSSNKTSPSFWGHLAKKEASYLSRRDYTDRVNPCQGHPFKATGTFELWCERPSLYRRSNRIWFYIPRPFPLEEKPSTAGNLHYNLGYSLRSKRNRKEFSTHYRNLSVLYYRATLNRYR